MSSTLSGLNSIYTGGIPQQGGSVGSFLKSANKFLKNTKAISKVSGLAGDLGVPYAGTISKVSKKLGYGKKKSNKKKK